MQYNKLKENLSKYVEFVKSFKKPDLGDNLLIISEHASRPAARILHMSFLSAGKTSYLYTPTESSFYLLPYNENVGNVIIFASKKDPKAIHAAEVARLMDRKIIFVSPEMDKNIEERLEYINALRIKIETEAPIITMGLLSLFWSSEQSGLRAERMKREIEKIDTSLEWLEEKYGDSIQRVRLIESDAIFAYTPSTEAGGIYAYYAVPNCLLPLPFELAIENRLRLPIVLLTSTTDIEDYKSMIIALKGNRKNEIVEFNTDPITAGIYSMLFISMVSGNFI